MSTSTGNGPSGRGGGARAGSDDAEREGRRDRGAAVCGFSLHADISAATFTAESVLSSCVLGRREACDVLERDGCFFFTGALSGLGGFSMPADTGPSSRCALDF